MVKEKLIAVRKKSQPKGQLIVDWFVGKRCNYDCSYCTPDIHDMTSKHLPLAYLTSIGDALVKHAGPEKLQIGFTGGEPTIHPEFLNLCAHLNSLGVKHMTTTTNLTRKVNYYLDLLQHMLSLTVSHHFEYENTAKFLQKVKQLHDRRPKNTDVRVQVMLHHVHFDACVQAVDFYKQNNIPYTLRRIRVKNKNTSSSDYTPEQLDWLAENSEPQWTNAVIFYKQHSEIKSQQVHVNEISGSLRNNFNGWICNAGVDYIHINWDGQVYRGNCRQGGVLGNITQPLALPTTPVTCQTTNCFCAPEISIRKHHPDVNINDFGFSML